MAVVITDEGALAHQVPPGHPERPARYKAVCAAIETAGPHWRSEQAAPASYEQLCLVHHSNYIDSIFAAVEGLDTADRLLQLDNDTYAGPGSLPAALNGAGAACRAVDLVMTEGQRGAVFSALRPPGHHAEPDRAMGFCIFSNAAIAARHAQEKWGTGRVAVLDFDVHHGNGTQAAFWSQKDLIYASSHQMPLYPGTGDKSETGDFGTIFNLPLSSGCSGEAFLQGWREHLLPRVRECGCDLVIISAGFDAHRRDPLGGLNVDTGDFAALTADIIALADEKAQGRVISLLEGGYDLDALRDSVSAHMTALGHLG